MVHGTVFMRMTWNDKATYVKFIHINKTLTIRDNLSTLTHIFLQYNGFHDLNCYWIELLGHWLILGFMFQKYQSQIVHGLEFEDSARLCRKAKWKWVQLSSLNNVYLIKRPYLQETFNGTAQIICNIIYPK